MTKSTIFCAQRVGLLVILLLLVQPSDTSAQAPPDDIFGTPTTPAPAPAGDVFGPATPAGQGAPVETADGAPADPNAFTPAAPPESDPAVLAVQESEPTTPAELLWAVETLLNLERPELAKQYLEQLQASQVSDEELIAAQRRFRTPLLLRIARDARLQPAGQAVVQRLIEAAQAAQEDVTRVSERVQMLQDADPAARHAALVDLRQLGAPGAAAILQALARTTAASQRDRFRGALAAFGAEAIGPLTAALRAEDARLRSDAIAALGDIGALETAVSLVRPALDASEPEVRQVARKALRQVVGVLPTLDEARIHLRRQAEARLNKSADAVDPLEAVDVWQWNAAEQRVARQRTQRSAAAMAEAAAIARDLLALFPDDADARQLYLLTQLQLAKLTEEDTSAASSGYRAQIEEFARSFGNDALESVLARALAEGFLPAAQGAVELLGEAGTSELLASIDGKPRPLVQALDHPSPALRRAAARAIAQIDPTSPYAGSSRLPDWLAYFARTSGERRALVAHPNHVQGQRIAGLFAGLGLQAEAVQTGEELFEQLRLQPDYELALISRAIQKPEAHHLLQVLRQDSHAATLPIGLMVDGADDDRVRNWAEDDPRLRLVLTPVDSEHLTLQIGSLWPLNNTHAISREQRIADAQLALQTFARWAEHEHAYGFYNVMSYEPTVEQALYVPELAAAAATVLGYFGTPSAQHALVDFASDTSQDLAARQRAAQAFIIAVDRRGLLLTTPQIAQQYDRYHASALLDESTQQVLGSLLETIERPTQSQVASQTQEAQP